MTTAEILEKIRDLHIAVIGDICLDRWCLYDPAEAEASRETGLDRIAVVSTEVTAGAGGTVANNLAALGVAHVEVIGVAGDDGYGYELHQALSNAGISTDSIIVSERNPTFTYTKVMNIDTQVEDRPRLDFIWSAPLDRSTESRLIDRLRGTTADAIIVSDQAEHRAGGVITAAIRTELSKPGRLIVADSRNHVEHFRNVILKPNEDEARAACARLGGVDLAALRRHASAPVLAVTHGGKGVLLINDAGEEWVPARKVAKPVDICGAGDSFSAGFTAALAAGASSADAARFGNRVAAVTIMKKGTGTATPKELLQLAHVGD